MVEPPRKTKQKNKNITDWPWEGIGFVILQKYCRCLLLVEKQLCCTDGWKSIYYNSHQLSKTEQNYASAKGEALAIKWALKKPRMFLLGWQFHVIVNHQPLLKIFGHKSFSNISNHQLLTFKEAIAQ